MNEIMDIEEVTLVHPDEQVRTTSRSIADIFCSDEGFRRDDKWLTLPNRQKINQLVAERLRLNKACHKDGNWEEQCDLRSAAYAAARNLTDKERLAFLHLWHVGCQSDIEESCGVGTVALTFVGSSADCAPLKAHPVLAREAKLRNIEPQDLMADESGLRSSEQLTSLLDKVGWAYADLVSVRVMVLTRQTQWDATSAKAYPAYRLDSFSLAQDEEDQRVLLVGGGPAPTGVKARHTFWCDFGAPSTAGKLAARFPETLLEGLDMLHAQEGRATYLEGEHDRRITWPELWLGYLDMETAAECVNSRDFDPDRLVCFENLWWIPARDAYEDDSSAPARPRRKIVTFPKSAVGRVNPYGELETFRSRVQLLGLAKGHTGYKRYRKILTGLDETRHLSWDLSHQMSSSGKETGGKQRAA